MLNAYVHTDTMYAQHTYTMYAQHVHVCIYSCSHLWVFASLDKSLGCLKRFPQVVFRSFEKLDSVEASLHMPCEFVDLCLVLLLELLVMLFRCLQRSMERLDMYGGGRREGGREGRREGGREGVWLVREKRQGDRGGEGKWREGKWREGRGGGRGARVQEVEVL